ncbi:MAG TPA: TonB-dependent receptor [Gemmatimonadales bacterium]|jgi:vitamin B12 transporter|nr:TonB-dependent receptor [Gemmatimonadales bacterium]
MKLTLRALTLLVLPASLAGQQPTDTVALNPVVVTATRLPMPAELLPTAVAVISGAQLREQGIRTVAEALRIVPAASIAGTGPYGGQTSLFLRGGASDYVKVLIDGVPQNAPGGAYDFANLTTDNVERIEVARGPASVLYGSDAMTGVVQIFTRDGRGPVRGSVSAGGGTFGSSAFDARVSGGDARAGYVLGVSRFSSDGVDTVNNAFRNEVLTGRLRWVPNLQTAAALSFRYGDALYHFPTDGAGRQVSNNQHQLDRGPSVGLDLGHAFSNRIDAHLTGTWRRDNAQYTIAPNGPSDTTTFPFASSDWVTRTGADGRANLRFPGGDIVTLGGAFEHEAMEGSTLAGPRSRDDGAAYAQLVTGLERLASLMAGARLEDNERFGSHATWRVGVSLRVVPGLRAVASAGTGFREPGFYEIFATGFVRGNPDLAPEKSRSWETGLEYTVPSRAATLRATYFDQRFRDLIQYSAQGVGPDSVNYINLADATARGLEVAGHAGLGATLTLGATYTYLDSRDGATGRRLQRRPTHAASVNLGYAIGGRGSASLAAVFTGDRDDYDYATFPATPVVLPPHTRVDLAGTFDVIRSNGARPGVGVDLRVENLLDARYEDVRNFPARRRALFFGGELRFGGP